MKNIIITGAAGNLGKAVTAEFSNGDYHMNLSVLTPTENTDLQTAWYPDLKNPEAVTEMIKSIEEKEWEIEATIHLVGGYKPGNLGETNPDDVNEMVALNFNTAFNLVHALLPHYQRNGGGKFIFIGAKAAMNAGTAVNNVAYALSKQMLVPFAEMINEAEKENNIKAHVLLPGTLDTALNRSFMPDADFTKWTSTADLAKTMREIVEGTETREVVLF
jgi:short-subunit dehydrogenase